MVYFRIKHTIFMLTQKQPRQWGWLLHTLFTQHAASLLPLHAFRGFKRNIFMLGRKRRKALKNAPLLSVISVISNKKHTYPPVQKCVHNFYIYIYNIIYKYKVYLPSSHLNKDLYKNSEITEITERILRILHVSLLSFFFINRVQTRAAMLCIAQKKSWKFI